MEENIKMLIQDYYRRIESIESKLYNGVTKVTEKRLLTKASCYRTFISELEKLFTQS